ncbi:MAG TPA: hypothetical protein VF691_04050 [Cytophagaceae bacterium]|jgi:hypothetical protein
MGLVDRAANAKDVVEIRVEFDKEYSHRAMDLSTTLKKTHIPIGEGKIEKNYYGAKSRLKKWRTILIAVLQTRCWLYDYQFSQV